MNDALCLKLGFCPPPIDQPRAFAEVHAMPTRGAASPGLVFASLPNKSCPRSVQPLCPALRNYECYAHQRIACSTVQPIVYREECHACCCKDGALVDPCDPVTPQRLLRALSHHEAVWNPSPTDHGPHTIPSRLGQKRGGGNGAQRRHVGS